MKRTKTKNKARNSKAGKGTKRKNQLKTESVESMPKKCRISVNGKKYLTDKKYLLQGLEEIGFDIPHLCFHEDFEPLATCRLCIVESDGKLVTSCNTAVKEGMNVKTDTEEILEARRFNLELILSDHPLDCDYCYKNLHCELQRIAEKITKTTRYKGRHRSYEKDESSAAIMRDMNQCILCGRCIAACEAQGVCLLNYAERGFNTIIAPPMNLKISNTLCISCGQCTLHCPTAAIIEKDERTEVYNALNDEKKFVIAQIAPSVRSSLGEEFGLKPGTVLIGKVAATLKQIGFDSVIDTSTGADFTIMEEANELVERLKKRENLPMFTSCCPAWINYVETFHPELIKNLSTTKSPHQILASVIKTYYAKMKNLEPCDIVIVSIMPCTAKKEEATRITHRINNIPTVDYVLTVREAAKMLREGGIDIMKLKDEKFDALIDVASGAGQIFGATGGVMEAALRTAEYFINGKNKKERIEFKNVRGMQSIKTAQYDLGKQKVRIAVVNGSGNAEKFLNMIKNKELEVDFIEVMACPGGCVGGGGQPIPSSMKIVTERAKALYEIDKKAGVRTSHENPVIKKVYKEFLKKPGSELAEQLLHTKYMEREKYILKEK